MEIFTLLETLEECLERAKTIPFTQKAIVNEEEIFFDIFGYESWQPMPSRVESVAIGESFVYAGIRVPYNTDSAY